jgi:hypothetical protein
MTMIKRINRQYSWTARGFVHAGALLADARFTA